MIHLFQQDVKEATMKRIMRIIGVIILVVAAAAAALVGKSFIAAKKPSVK